LSGRFKRQVVRVGVHANHQCDGGDYEVPARCEAPVDIVSCQGLDVAVC
jgi:hypothetical protein